MQILGFILLFFLVGLLIIAIAVGCTIVDEWIKDDGIPVPAPSRSRRYRGDKQ